VVERGGNRVQHGRSSDERRAPKATLFTQTRCRPGTTFAVLTLNNRRQRQDKPDGCRRPVGASRGEIMARSQVRDRDGNGATAQGEVLRVGALADFHCTKTSQGMLQPLFARVSEVADVLLLCGDLTDYGLPEEAHVLARELNAVKVPKVAVLGNHDFE